MTQQSTQLKAGDALPTVRKQLTQESINRYADVSGDGNPLHVDPEFAANTQFEGTIAHGMLVLAYLSEMLTAAFGREWLETGRLKVRLRAPARPGDAIETAGTVAKSEDGVVTCDIEAKNAAGEVLINGAAEVGPV